MEQLNVRILERDYRLSCEPDEKDALLAAVEYVDGEMRKIREQGKVSTPERIAVFAALHLASRLLARPAIERAMHDAGIAVADPELARRMRAIDGLLDRALATQDPLF